MVRGGGGGDLVFFPLTILPPEHDLFLKSGSQPGLEVVRREITVIQKFREKG
jgi:hypothetical protein